MKDVLIIFTVLLVLLLVISTLGGSIRMKEKFETHRVTVPTLNVPDTTEVLFPNLNSAFKVTSVTDNFTVGATEEEVEGFDGNVCFASIAQSQ